MLQLWNYNLFSIQKIDMGIHNSFRQTGGDQDGTTIGIWGIQRTTAELMTEFNQPD